jgi:hypothetical protein
MRGRGAGPELPFGTRLCTAAKYNCGNACKGVRHPRFVFVRIAPTGHAAQSVRPRHGLLYFPFSDSHDSRVAVRRRQRGLAGLFVGFWVSWREGSGVGRAERFGARRRGRPSERDSPN